MISLVKLIKETYQESNPLDGFKYDVVKKHIQSALNNGNLTLSDISPDRYFIVAIGSFNKYISTSTATNKNTAESIVLDFKNNEEVWKIYVEKPTVGSVVYLRKEWGWERK
jgi:hypothetical protein